MDKCKVLVVNDGKQVRSDGVELPSGEVMKDVQGGPKKKEHFLKFHN